MGDLHGNIRRLAELPGLNKAAGILLTGDITTRGSVASARKTLDSIRHCNSRVLALFGNMDRPEVAAWLQESGMGLHRTVVEIAPDTVVMGLGGSSFTPFGTPSEFPESLLAAWLEAMWVHARSFSRVILVSHTPPYGTRCDLAGGERHVGSTAVRDFIMNRQPDVCLCGHIHEARSEDKLGKTIIVNPGTLNDGGYAVLTPGTHLVVTRHLL